MSTPNDVTDKQIRKTIRKASQPCPCCGSLLSLMIEGPVDPRLEREIVVLYRKGMLHLGAIEDAEETTRKLRDEGRFEDETTEYIRSN